MRQMGIRAQWSKPWTITTKDSDFSTELQNILDEQFNPDRPNAVWCSDITYIWTIDGFVYLTSIMDLFSRKIIAWTVSFRNTGSILCDWYYKQSQSPTRYWSAPDNPLGSWQPFTFNDRMEGFDAGIIPRKRFLWITTLHIFGCFFIFLCNIPTDFRISWSFLQYQENP